MSFLFDKQVNEIYITFQDLPSLFLEFALERLLFEISIFLLKYLGSLPVSEEYA